MSLESKIEVLTAAVVALTAKLEQFSLPKPVVEEVSAPVVQEVTTPTPVAVMPPPPSFIIEIVDEKAVGAPFTDGKGLIEYVMTAYKSMGPEKGSRISNVLNELGYQNINEVRPEHYAKLYAGIEALK